MTSPTVTPTPAPSVSSTKAPMTFPGTVLTPGSKGSAVLAVQQRLNKLGCGPVLEDGTFGAETQDAVELFQTRFQDTSGAPLKIDGTVGPMTWAALFGAATTPTNATAPSQLLAAVLQFAYGEVGMMEDPLESNRGPRIYQYLRAVGLDPAAGSFPRCAAFVYFCFQQAANTLKCRILRSETRAYAIFGTKSDRRVLDGVLPRRRLRLRRLCSRDGVSSSASAVVS